GELHVLPHFVGASPESSTLRGLLRSLCGELRQLLDVRGEVPEETGALAGLFRELLWRFSSEAGRRLVLVLDGIDQLDAADHAHTLHWLPERLPPGVALVASCVDDNPLSPT